MTKREFSTSIKHVLRVFNARLVRVERVFCTRLSRVFVYNKLLGIF